MNKDLRRANQQIREEHKGMRDKIASFLLAYETPDVKRRTGPEKVLIHTLEEENLKKKEKQSERLQT